MSEKANYENARAYLTENVAAAESFLENAREYIERLGTLPILKLKAGKFFSTIDGSIIQILNKLEPGTCPGCGSNHGTDALASIRAQMQKAMEQITGERAHVHIERIDGDDPDETDGSDDPVMWKALVIRGGHGHKRLTGEKPGELILLDGAGLVVVTKLADDNGERQIVPAFLRQVGLCCVSEVKAEFKIPEVKS